MNRLLITLILLNIFSIPGCATTNTKPSLTNIEIASSIRTKYESNLFQLSPRVQGHYALRLYRITGNVKYLNAVLYDYYVISDRITSLIYNMDDKNYRKTQSEYLKSLIINGRRGRARIKTLNQDPEFILYGGILAKAVRFNEYGYAVPDKLIKVLKEYNFKYALTNKKMIKAWAAQLSNYAYWLRQLNIADYTHSYKKAFIKTYPNSKDVKLSKWQFKNKVYGLTHFIFGASEYYQYPVSVSEFKWILDYFTKNQDRILNNTSADVISEVALCFLLAQQESAPFINLAKQYLKLKFNVEASLIPSISGKIDINSGEHRNVLALMVFIWPKQLYPGPKFNELIKMQKYLPRSLEIYNNPLKYH